jgi:drug/metabolite transporter (DMT)-like permease
MYWLTYSILATIFLGFSMVFYKLPSYKNYSSFISTIATNALSTIFVVIILWISTGSVDIHTISWYGLAWGATFCVSMVLYKKLLNGRDTGIIFPAVSSVGNAVTVLVGIIVLSERISLIQTLGILTIFLSIYFFQKKDGKLTFNKEALILALGIIIFSTTQKFIQKLGAEHETVQHFMTYQYLGATLFALFLTSIFERGKLKELFALRKYLKGAILISLFSVLGGYMIFKALSLAPLSQVYAIHPMYTLVSAMLGVWLFKEKVTSRKVLLIFLSIAGVILLRIG